MRTSSRPRLELRRILLDEIQNVLLRVCREGLLCRRGGLPGGTLRQRAPQVVELRFLVRLALRKPRRLRFVGERRGTTIPVDTVRHQRMARVDHLFHRRRAVPLLALHHIAPRKNEVIEDRVRRRPLAKQVVALEERIVTVGGMRDDERLRRHGVFLHQVRDARIRVDDDFVGQTLHSAPVRLLVADELLAVGPVRIADRQAARRIGVDHLLGGDDLDLVGIRVEPVLGRDLGDRGVVALEQLEIPICAGGDGAHRGTSALAVLTAIPS